ncbi:MAG TPA: rhamnulose-1-phosphate aldolase [Thermoplasmata archaeon]|nr:rhamnulose-1-phosphate aldolase [Thermoplasmata archaeon]
MWSQHEEIYKPFFEEFRKVAHWLSLRGWAEANAGNMSLRLHEKNIPSPLSSIYKEELKRAYPHLKGKFLAITGARKRMRDIALGDFVENISIIRICENGKSYETYFGPEKPTSELPTHLEIHSKLVALGKKERAVVHTHPTKLVALSHTKAFSSAEGYLNILFKLHPETSILLAEGVAYLDYQLPGSYELGKKTAEAITTKKLVIWQHHGVVAIGESLSRSLDRIELLEKAAEIYFLVRAVGEEPKGIKG